MQKQIIVIGASRGIGAAVAKHFAEQGHVLISVSRTKPAAGEWIQADISTPEGINKVASKINKSPWTQRSSSVIKIGSATLQNRNYNH